MSVHRSIAYSLGFCLAVLCSRTITAESVELKWPNKVLQLRSTYPVVDSSVITAVSLQPGGAHIAAAGDGHEVHVWDAATGDVVHRLAGHTDWVRSVAYSPDGNVLATAGNDRKILLWDARSGSKLRVFARHEQAITNITYSHHGRLLAASGFQDTLRVYDTNSGRQVAKFSCPCPDMRALAFSPDDSLLAAAGRNGVIRIYDLNSNSRVRDLQAHRLRVHHLRFSHDGQAIISCGEDRRIQVSAVNGDGGFTLPSQGAKVMALAIYAPGRLATAGTDNMIRLWNLETRAEIGHLRGHAGSVAALATDGVHLVSGSYDTTVRVWKMQVEVADDPGVRTGRVEENAEADVFE